MYNTLRVGVHNGNTSQEFILIRFHMLLADLAFAIGVSAAGHRGMWWGIRGAIAQPQSYAHAHANARLYTLGDAFERFDSDG